MLSFSMVLDFASLFAACRARTSLAALLCSIRAMQPVAGRRRIGSGGGMAGVGAQCHLQGILPLFQRFTAAGIHESRQVVPRFGSWSRNRG